MKKSLKIISIIMLLINLMGFLPIIANATWSPSSTISTLDELHGNQTITKPVQDVMGTAINVIRIVGTGISIIMITYIAIKYMSAAPNEKAEFKKSATAFVVGAVIFFAATQLLMLLADFASATISTTISTTVT